MRNVTMSSLRSAIAQVLLVSGMEERGERAVLSPIHAAGSIRCNATMRSPVVTPLLQTSNECLVLLHPYICCHWFQDMVLFNDTIYYNIAYGDLNATKEQVEAAAQVWDVGRGAGWQGGT